MPFLHPIRRLPPVAALLPTRSLHSGSGLELFSSSFKEFVLRETGTPTRKRGLLGSLLKRKAYP
jgi:hypothetical protein